MSREVRMVPRDWQHPKEPNGKYLGLCNDDPDMQSGDWYQMYETTSEGTPISPVMETKEELARWLADNKASAFGSMTATYEEWLKTIERGWAPTIMIFGGELTSGVSGINH